MDDFDLSLLDLLAEDSRQTHAELAKKLGVAPSSIARRIATLQASGVLRKLTIDLDYAKLGQASRAIVTGKFGHNRYASADIIERLVSHPNVLSVDTVFGMHDFVAEIIAPSPGEFVDIIKELEEIAGNGETNTFIVAHHRSKIPSLRRLKAADIGRHKLRSSEGATQQLAVVRDDYQEVRNDHVLAAAALMALKGKDNAYVDLARDDPIISRLIGLPAWLTRTLIIRHLERNLGPPTVDTIDSVLAELEGEGLQESGKAASGSSRTIGTKPPKLSGSAKQAK